MNDMSESLPAIDSLNHARIYSLLEDYEDEGNPFPFKRLPSDLEALLLYNVERIGFTSNSISLIYNPYDYNHLFTIHYKNKNKVKQAIEILKKIMMEYSNKWNRTISSQLLSLYPSEEE
jgi:hypothetical protein